MLDLNQLFETVPKNKVTCDKNSEVILEYFNRYSIIRTYSAGVWFGKITARNNDKVKVEDARRMYYWKCNKSISLSGCAVYGIDHDSKICGPVKSVWISDIEIIECTDIAIDSIKNYPIVEAN